MAETLPPTDAPAPDFTVPDQNGEPLLLSALRGKPVVLFFYPKADTPGWTSEARGFRDAFEDFQAAGAEVLGISPDPSKKQAKFAEKQELPFRLLSDSDHAVAEAYGVWKEKSFMGRKYMGVERSTFVIDKDGILRQAFPKVSVDGHAREVLKVVQALE